MLWFENIIVPSSSGSLCRSMRGESSSSIESLKVSNMISLISLVTASKSACVATPASISSLPYDTMQSCASHASTSSLVRYDDASEGEWPL